MGTSTFSINLLLTGEIIKDLNREESEYLNHLKDSRKKLMHENLKEEMHPTTKKHLQDINNKIKFIINSNLHMVIINETQNKKYYSDITLKEYPNTFNLLKNNFNDKDYFTVEIKIYGNHWYSPQTYDSPEEDEIEIDSIDEVVFSSDGKEVMADSNTITEIENMSELFEPIYNRESIIPKQNYSDANYDDYDDYDKYSSTSLDTFIKKAN